jgi:hypothetical protein
LLGRRFSAASRVLASRALMLAWRRKLRVRVPLSTKVLLLLLV